MKKQKYLPIIAAFAALILLVLIFLVQGNLNHSAEVILPEETEQHDSSGTPTDTSDETIRRVEVRPDTVQSVIETLARPENYSCTVTLERYYDGGSATSVAELRVAFPWTRIDMNEGGSVTTRHAIVGEENCYIWYGDNVKYFTSNSNTILVSNPNKRNVLFLVLLDFDTKALSYFSFTYAPRYSTAAFFSSFVQ